MKYPRLSLDDTTRIARLRVNGESAPAAPNVLWVGEGDAIDLSLIEIAGEIVRAELPNVVEFRDRDLIEGRFSKLVYEAVHELPVVILDDPGFWRFAALEHFWDFTAWRESSAFANGNHLRYVDGRKSTETVVTRMYLRIAALGGLDFADMAGRLDRGADFWRSHVIRVRTSASPTFTRALLGVQLDKTTRLTTGKLRKLARDLNRSRANLIANYVDELTAELLVSELSAYQDPAS